MRQICFFSETFNHSLLHFLHLECSRETLRETTMLSHSSQRQQKQAAPAVAMKRKLIINFQHRLIIKKKEEERKRRRRRRNFPRVYLPHFPLHITLLCLVFSLSIRGHANEVDGKSCCAKINTARFTFFIATRERVRVR
jgi:hypothetical protein